MRDRSGIPRLENTFGRGVKGQRKSRAGKKRRSMSSVVMRDDSEVPRLENTFGSDAKSQRKSRISDREREVKRLKREKSKKT